MLAELIYIVFDGTIVDTKGWGGWEWTQGIALTALYHVSLDINVVLRIPADLSSTRLSNHHQHQLSIRLRPL